MTSFKNNVPAKMNQTSFGHWLTAVTGQIGAHSAASIRMDNPLLRQKIAVSNGETAAWLQAGMHGEMEYLQQMFPAKANPWKTFPFAKSVLIITFTNRWGDLAATQPFPEPENEGLLGYVSAAARETDYHTTGQSLLLQLAQSLGTGIRTAATVDTKAVNERLFATVGGLGEIGANSLLRLPSQVGTRVFIGCLFVDIELPEVIHTPQMPFDCSTCGACVKCCPTGAIGFERHIDARKCISYLTIEKKELLSRHEAETIGDWLYGCDYCTTVCPPADTVATRIPVDLEWLLKAPAGQVRRVIQGNATAYAGVTRLRRNAVAVLHNMATPAAQQLLMWVDENTGSELIRRQLKLLYPKGSL
ncbi:MAG: epoxyqueuosine reductase [Desulfuromonadales bacterium]|nr:epoxyqueuosine reductase [Desulfuromonadales bacterium]